MTQGTSLNRSGQSLCPRMSRPNVAEYKDHKKDIEVKEEVEKESEEEFTEDIEEKTKEEEEDDPKYFDMLPTIDELRYHEWILKNPQPPWVSAKIRTGNMDNIKIKCMIDQLHKKQAYIDLESPINVMSRLNYRWIMSEGLKSRRKSTPPVSLIITWGVVLEKPFVMKIELIYDKDEGTIKFEKEGEKIVFKMPHKMEMFKHVEKDILKTDNIPSFVITGDDGNQEKTHYSENLNLGLAYRRDESTTREIQSLIKIKSRRNEEGVTILQEVNNRIACRIFFQENEYEFFTEAGDGVRVIPDSVRLYLMRRSLEFLRKFPYKDSWMTI
ncbi:hypothetical protein Tco_1034091 [Tanacetum coccineum]